LRVVALALGALATLGTSGCEREPAVEIATWVGPRHAKQDPERLAAESKKVNEVALAEILPSAAPEDSAEMVAQLAAHPPTTEAELQGLVDAVRKGHRAELAGPAHRIAAADPALWPVIKTMLLAERKAPKGDYRSLLKAIGGDVPNRYGHFSLAWKKAHGHRVKLSQDWFADLLVLPGSKVSPMLSKVYRDCVLQTALLRAASQIGAVPERTDDVVATLLTAAYHHQGTFRDEVGRAMQGIGDEAIAALVRSSAPPPGKVPDDDPRVQRARYAQVQLDRMDRLHPQRAIDAVRSDPRRLTDVLIAYGTTKVGEAAAPLLDYADAADPSVRTAARDALLAYVKGPAPRGQRRTIRLLGGGTSHARAYLTYRQRASLAITERMASEMPEHLEPDCGAPDRGEDTRSAAQIEACGQQPRRHVEAYFAALDQRRAVRRAQRLDAAIAQPSVQRRVEALDQLLASEPNLPETDQLVAQYRGAALAALDEKDTAKAAQLLRKSAMLTDATDPKSAQELRVSALIAEASTDGLSAQGRSMLLATAVSMAPDDPQLAAAYASARDTQAVATDGTWPWQRMGMATGGGLLTLGLLGLAFGPLRRRLW